MINGILKCLHWQDYRSIALVSVASCSKIKVWVTTLSADLSLGTSELPISCESERSDSSGTDEQSRWFIGGPIPPTFNYIDELVFPCEVPHEASDLLGGCSCDGICGVGNGKCSCVLLNAAANR